MYETHNSKLTEFVLCGVGVVDSQAHICRSITRRVERQMWKLNNSNYIVKGKKEIKISELHWPTEHMAADFKIYETFFEGALGKNRKQSFFAKS